MICLINFDEVYGHIVTNIWQIHCECFEKKPAQISIKKKKEHEWGGGGGGGVETPPGFFF